MTGLLHAEKEIMQQTLLHTEYRGALVLHSWQADGKSAHLHRPENVELASSGQLATLKIFWEQHSLMEENPSRCCFRSADTSGSIPIGQAHLQPSFHLEIDRGYKEEVIDKVMDIGC